MQKTIKQPDLIPIQSGYYLAKDYVYEWHDRGRDYRITIPKGFECDGASVPRILWTLTGITPDGYHRPAALVHDYLYRHHGRIPQGRVQIMDHLRRWHAVNKAWTRESADKLFARILRELGISKFRRRLMYIGVRLGGWTSW